MKKYWWGVFCLSLLPQYVAADDFITRLAATALEHTQQKVRYDGRYMRIDYPGGDVPADIGVCTDVIIRVYRKLGIDLQQLVHLDMREHFEHYPSKRIWGLNRPDTNIDHRRVPNLQTFFSRHGQTFPVSAEGNAYKAGDLVSWMLPGNLPHIGIVTDKLSADGLRPLIVHNIGAGTVVEDMLFKFTITGHYRYIPD